MQRSVLDRIYLAFLVILIVSFGFLIFFISYFTRRSLILEKRTTLSNEATLISSQVIPSYMNGTISTKELASYFNIYARTLKSDIWYVDEDGAIIATSGYFDDSNSSENKQATSDRPDVAVMKKLPKSI